MITVRASSVCDLLDCPKRWEAKHIYHMTVPISASARIGTAIHKATCYFDNARIMDSRPPLDNVLATAADDIWQVKEEPTDWGECPQSEAETIAKEMSRMYCTQIAPMFHFKECEVQLPNVRINDLDIELQGQVDRITELNAIGEMKSGKSVVSPDGTVGIGYYWLQVGIYEFMLAAARKVKIGEPSSIIGLQVAKTARGRRVGIGKVIGARAAVVGTPEEPGILHHVSAILKSGMFPGNPRSNLCNPKFCPCYKQCHFHG